LSTGLTNFSILTSLAHESVVRQKAADLHSKEERVGVGEIYFLILRGGVLPQKIFKIKMPDNTFWLYFCAKLSLKISEMTFCFVFKISVAPQDKLNYDFFSSPTSIFTRPGRMGYC
jgi:hypothetical protein